AVQGGYQGALMAPTEVLAEQHHLGVRDLLADLSVPASADEGSLFDERPLRVELLTNRTPAGERTKLRAALRSGEVDILIGTHALLTEGVEFSSLGVAIIDEQHRFGVEQRAALRGKGDDPDVLVMTATPIPRTAAMTVYGDLDVTVLDELPPGRTPATTVWAGGEGGLGALVRTTAGFELAEVDLELRGEGTILGARQKGRSDLKLASLRRDKELVARAREVAFAIVDSDPMLDHHPDLRDEVE